MHDDVDVETVPLDPDVPGSYFQHLQVPPEFTQTAVPALAVQPIEEHVPASPSSHALHAAVACVTLYVPSATQS
jgi:hypothetical protein